MRWASAIRSSSRLRVRRSTSRASSTVSTRVITARNSRPSTSRERGRSCSSRASQRTASGIRSSSSPTYLLAASTLVSRLAARPESRSSPMYQWAEPISSERRRKASSPRSGSIPSANHSSIAGSSWRWILARREIPSVREEMCASARPGSR